MQVPLSRFKAEKFGQANWQYLGPPCAPALALHTRPRQSCTMPFWSVEDVQCVGVGLPPSGVKVSGTGMR